MYTHPTPIATRRSALCALAFGIVVSLSPVALDAAPARADAPATAVTGLSQGARGDSVKAVQQALVNQGIAVQGGVDGIFGSGTAAAVKQFQSKKGLASTGQVDGATALSLGLATSPLLGLTQGNRGDAVKSLQQKLIDNGIAVSGGADGIFGPGTATGLAAFQSSKGLKASTSVDAATAAALGSVSDKAVAGTPAAQPVAAQPAAAAPSGFVGMKIGAKGDQVKQLQQMLINSGFAVVGGADGIFGVLTANALSSFQYSKGFKANAIVDDATATALQAAGGKPAAPAAGSGQSPAAASPYLGLKQGTAGDKVRNLQQALLDAGVKVRGGADGIFGPATASALKSYQSAKGLTASGSVDDATASALGSGQPVTGAKPVSALLGLKAGALGSSVKSLQQSLMDAGVKVRGGADGIFGPATANALKEFQTSQGITATGAVDDATVAALASPKAPSAANVNGFASYGERGNRVMALQSALVKAGVAVRGGVDGQFGAGTSAAVMDFQRVKGLRVTGRVDAATAAALAVAAAPAPKAPDASTVKIAAFPVQGRCYYGDSWNFARGGGRVHLGVDIIAPSGKLLYAAADGKITKVYNDYPGSLSGNGVRLTMADGTYFFYAHMSSVAEGIELGVPVKAGQIVGYVGSTGNSGTPHLHFEVHPQGGAAVNPYPLIKAIDGCGRTEPLPQP